MSRQDKVLAALDEHDLTIEQIADATAMCASVVSKIVRELECRGDICRVAIVTVFLQRGKLKKKPSQQARIKGRERLVYSTDLSRAQPMLEIVNGNGQVNRAPAKAIRPAMSSAAVVKSAMRSRQPLELAWMGLAA